MAPTDCPHLILQAMAGPLAAATASTVTNPMDVVRARVQVSTQFHCLINGFFSVYYVRYCKQELPSSQGWVTVLGAKRLIPDNYLMCWFTEDQ